MTDNRGLIHRADLVLPCGGADRIERGFVEVAGDTITRVGRQSDLCADGRTEGQRSIDHGAACLLPGLIDVHVHVQLPGDGNYYIPAAPLPDDLVTLIAQRNATAHLDGGITTIRDNGSRGNSAFAVRTAIELGYVRGPRMLVSGAPITTTGGHMASFTTPCDSSDQMVAHVHRVAAQGADHVKLVCSGGSTPGSAPDAATYTVEQLRTATYTAHELGMLSTAHCASTESMQRAIKAGVDTLEHGYFFAPRSLTQRHSLRGTGGMVHFLPQYDQRIVDEALQAGTYISNTLQAGGYRTLLQLRRRGAHEQLDQSDRNRLADLTFKFETKVALFADLIAGGMGDHLLISSDSGSKEGEFGSLVPGLILAVEAGMSPLNALTAVTTHAARSIGFGDRIGVLAPGYAADLLVVGGNPAERIRDLTDVRAVYVAGELVAPATGLATRPAPTGWRTELLSTTGPDTERAPADAGATAWSSV